MADESKGSPDDIAFAKTLPPVSSSEDEANSDEASSNEGRGDDARSADDARRESDEQQDGDEREGGLVGSPTLAPPGHEDDIARAPTADTHQAVALEHAVTDVGAMPPPKPRDDALHNLLAALVEQARALASRIAGDPERANPCHFCGGPLALWENLLVLQLAGVPAHVACPKPLLDERLANVGPSPEFPYQSLSEEVDKRVEQARRPDQCAGTIEVAI